MGIVLLFLCSLVVLIQFSFVQTFIAHRLTNYLSEELKTKVVVDKVQINFLSGFSLDGVYIEDLHGDTLFYSKLISLKVKDFSSADKKIIIQKIILQETTFNLAQYQNEEHDNLYFLTEYFSSTDTTSSSTPVAWNIRFENLHLENVAFKYKLEGDSLSPVGINFSDVAVNNINGDIENVYFAGDSLFLDVKKLAFREKSGFVVDNFQADAKIAGDQMRFEDLLIKSPFTDIKGNLTFEYDSFADFKWFTRLIHWKADFEKHRSILPGHRLLCN